MSQVRAWGSGPDGSGEDENMRAYFFDSMQRMLDISKSGGSQRIDRPTNEGDSVVRLEPNKCSFEIHVTAECDCDDCTTKLERCDDRLEKVTAPSVQDAKQVMLKGTKQASFPVPFATVDQMPDYDRFDGSEIAIWIAIFHDG